MVMGVNLYNKYQVTNIEYDSDGEELDIADSFIFYVRADREQEVLDDGGLVDRVSDETGWLILDCAINKLDDGQNTQLDTDELIIKLD